VEASNGSQTPYPRKCERFWTLPRLCCCGSGGRCTVHVPIERPWPVQPDGAISLDPSSPSRHAHLDRRLYVFGWLRLRPENREHIFSRHNRIFRRDRSLWLGSSLNVLAYGPRKWAGERKMVWPQDRPHQRKFASLRRSATALAARLPDRTSFCAGCGQFGCLALGRYRIAGDLLHALLECRRAVYCGRAAKLDQD